MASTEEKIKATVGGGGGGVQQTNLLEEMKLLKEIQDQSGTRKAINSLLWYACAGPLVNLPHVGSLAYYFPQGHSEQVDNILKSSRKSAAVVAVSTKRSATSQIPNYPNPPSQLLCQVHNVTLHADKDTDEIFAQMSLQPVNSEKDVFPIPDFGLKPNKHPADFFCKTLTASDTSTHGGFSVPRRAAEKLFPPLDYTMQPPTQELVVRDLHDNTWTFRHIYRGQPKRHLLTTGWSLFVGSKRLKAGDSVLFVRDEKSQLMVGVRRANRQQTTLPSSVLSADSMHIGILAAAAHAAANRSPFTIFYNPRACPSEFVIPLAKYRKAVYGTQLSVGMRFGMMFETEESSKRRYMGTIVGIGDLDSLRWPGSKWRNLQVEWDEPGCSDKHTRVSPWEIETPESLFIFPSLTLGLKRPFPSGFLGGETGWGNLIKRQLSSIPQPGDKDLPYSSISNLCSEQLINMLMKPQGLNCPGIRASVSQEMSVADGALFEDVKIMRGLNQIPHLSQPEVTSIESQHLSQFSLDQSDCVNPSMSKMDSAGKLLPANKVEVQKPAEIPAEKLNLEPEHSNTNQLRHSGANGECNQENSLALPSNQQTSGNQLVQNQNPGHLQMPANLCQVQPLLESSLHPQQMHLPPSDSTTLNGSYPCLNNNTGEWVSQPPPYMSLAGIHRSPAHSPMFGLQDLPAVLPEGINSSLPLNQEIWDQQLENLRFLSQAGELTPLAQQYPCNNSTAGGKDWSDESNNQSGICNSLIDVSNGGDAVIDPSVSSAILDEFCTSKDNDIQHHPSDCFVGNFSSSQDVQSQITSVSLADSQAFSQQDLPDSSGGTSCSNIDFDKNNLLQTSSWQQMAPAVRTYTKVQKAGSVGRSIDVSSFKNYEELCSAIECMFGLHGLLNNPRATGWKLVYVDYENDVLLIGDDPWEEFVGCVRCIRILSPSEVQQMSEEGMKLLNNANMQGIGGPIAEGSHL